MTLAGCDYTSGLAAPDLSIVSLSDSLSDSNKINKKPFWRAHAAW